MPDPAPLVIVGAGGLGRGVAALVERLNRSTPTWTLAGFVDDNEALHEDTVMGYPVRGPLDWVAQRGSLSFVLAIGEGESRRRIAEHLRPSDAQPVALSHPSTDFHHTADVAPGAIIRKGVATAVNVDLGPHAVLNLNCTLGHDSRLDAFVTLHPGVHVSGNAHLKPGVTVGTGAVVLPGVTIGARTTVGAGAVVTDDLPPDCTAVGTPAQPR